MQVGKILRAESFSRLIARLFRLLPEFLIARIAANHVLAVRLKKILQGKAPLFCRKIARRLGGNIEEGVARAAGDVILDLNHQRGDQVERLPDLGKFLQ